MAYTSMLAKDYDVFLKTHPKLDCDGEETLREDFEVGIYDGVFEILYTGVCQTCGFSHTFRHKEKV